MTTPNTPKRPDVEAIGGRADDIAHPVIRARSIADWAADIYALIAWIEALEARMVKKRNTVYQTIDRFQDIIGWQKGESRNKLVCEIRDKVDKSFAALGDGDG